jgi:hypothetical protein
MYWPAYNKKPLELIAHYQANTDKINFTGCMKYTIGIITFI